MSVQVKNLRKHLKYYECEGKKYRVQNIKDSQFYFYPVSSKPDGNYVFCVYDDDCQFRFINHATMKTIKVIEDYPRDEFKDILKELNKLNNELQ